MKKKYIWYILTISILLLISIFFIQRAVHNRSNSKTTNPLTNQPYSITNYKFDSTKKSDVLSMIELPYDDVESLSLEGNTLFTSVLNYPKGNLIAYDLKSKSEQILFKSPLKTSYQELMINKDWILWRDCGDEFTMNTIYARNRKTGKDKVIYNEKHSCLIVPCLYNNFAAWIDYSQKGILLYDLNTGRSKIIGTINELDFYNMFIYMSDNMLLWTDCINGKGYYLLYDLNTGKTNKIEAPCKYPGYAEMTQGKIFSLNFMNDYHNWTLNRLGVFDISTKEYKQLCDSAINLMRVGENSIAVMDRNNKLILYIINNNNLIKVTDILGSQGIDGIYYSEGDKLIVEPQTKTKQKNNCQIAIIDVNRILEE